MFGLWLGAGFGRMGVSPGGAGGDPLAPGSLAIDLQAASDTGTSNSDNITSDTTPTFNVTFPSGNVNPAKDAAVDDSLIADVDGVDLTPIAVTQNHLDGIDPIDLGATPLTEGTRVIGMRLERGVHVGPRAAIQLVIDTTAPTISTLNPADNATGVSATANLVATFDENVAFGTGNITLFDSDNDTIEAFDVATEQGTGNGQVSISGAVLTINPTAAMEGNKGHYVQIAATAIDDIAGNSFAGIANTTTWSFTTSDVAAPTISSLDPADNSTDHPIADSLVATFNENIAFGDTVSISLFLTNDTLVEAWDETDIGAGISISGAALTINPTSNLSNATGYYVQITSGSIEDASGNPFTGITDETTWSFTTASGAVAITQASSATGSGAVSAADLTTYTFSNLAAGGSDGDGHLIIGVTYRAAGSVTTSSVTVEGAGATSVVSVVDVQGGNTSRSEIWIIDRPAVDPVDVVVTLSAGAVRASVNLWKMIGAGSATASDTGGQANADPMSDTLVVPANGASVGISMCAVDTGLRGVAWTNLTESLAASAGVAVVVEAGNPDAVYSAACADSVAGGSIAMTCNYTNPGAGNGVGATALATWGP